MEEALIEMYLAGVSVRRVEDITEAFGAVRSSHHHQRAEQESLLFIRGTGATAFAGRALSVCLRIHLPQLGREYEKNVAVLVAIAVNGEDAS